MRYCAAARSVVESNVMSGKQPKRKDRPGVDRYGRTELHYAANESNLAKAQELVKANADVNATDDNGWTPLHFAAQSYALAIAKLLLEAGAKIDATDSHGNTPSHSWRRPENTKLSWSIAAWISTLNCEL